jgi:hypothetical protein
MPHIKRLPLPEPFTVDVAVRHLYLAYSNQGAARLSHIELVNPRMVDALYSLWRAEHSGEQSSSEREEQVAGILPGAGRWRLSRSSDGAGSIDIE